MRLLWRAWITLAAVIVLLAAKPAVAQNCACVPPVNAGYGIREYLHIGIDPAVAQNSNYTNAFIDGANYWNTYWNNHGIQLGFLMDGAYGAADINVTVDPSLIGTGFGAVNTHDVNGRGTIRLNPEFYGNDPLMYKIAAHELGHSTGF